MKEDDETKPEQNSVEMAKGNKDDDEPSDAAKPARVPVRDYLEATIVPILRDGLKQLNRSRPNDPLLFLADYLLQRRQLLKSGE